MSKDQDRTVSPREDGRWDNKRNDATRPSSAHSTQREAQEAARKNLKNQGGGELTTQGENGQFRDKDTVAPQDDSQSSKG